jgi:pyruvate dehydrogenase E1 component beta subunit
VWPWDQERILSSLERTGHLVMVEESSRANGWSSAIAAEVASSAFGLLRAPIARVTAPDVPVPFSPPLEARFRPTPAEVAAQVTSLVTDGRVLDPWWVRDGMVP